MTTAKKSHFLSRTAAVVVLSLFVITACRHENEGGVRIPVPKDTSDLAEINHFIPVDDINNFKTGFAGQRDSLAKLLPSLYFPLSETFNKQALLDLLKDSTNVGIRVYYGLKTGGNRNEVRLILVGVNSRGQDLYYERGGEVGKIAGQIPSGKTGGVEYGQCDPPCLP